VPSQQGIWLEDHQRLYTFRPQSVKPDPENPLALTKTDSLAVTMGNQRQLLAQSKYFKL